MRAPSFNVKASERGNPVRSASLHYHGSTKAEESENTYYAPAHVNVKAWQSRGNYQPHLSIQQPAHLPGCPEGCNVAHGRPFLHLECPDVVALGALATIEVWHEPENDTQPADSMDEEEAIQWVIDQVASGNEWAWCRVTVRVRWAGFEARTYLGGCSYRSRDDFERPGGYLDQMIDEALTDLASNIEAAATLLKEQGGKARHLLESNR